MSTLLVRMEKFGIVRTVMRNVIRKKKKMKMMKMIKVINHNLIVVVVVENGKNMDQFVIVVVLIEQNVKNVLMMKIRRTNQNQINFTKNNKP